MSEPDILGSVSVCIRDMKRGDQAAVAAVCDRVLENLARIAKRKLRRSACGICEGDDVAIEVIEMMRRALLDGRLDTVIHRDDLWSLLVDMASQRAADVSRSERRLKRGGKFQTRTPEEDVPSPSPPVGFELEQADEVEYLMGLLPNEMLREIARRKIDGQTAAEIAAEFNITERSVWRKLALIRRVWPATDAGGSRLGEGLLPTD